jgi:hypothetical protein
MLVRILQNIAGPDVDLRVNDEAEMEDAEAIRHIQVGHAAPVAPVVERAVKAAPEKRKK